ncbi:hypothetical protein SAMN05216564_11315 [Halopenitus persicus]|uniref:Uncharacterized protein n=1 Tax=Halopenitus persicus TaxID=1048396 RepID=A0A1H3NIL3_9EURY|nr:hypothetical protein SAMN05216564_11315 [Halopenitus persicus]
MKMLLCTVILTKNKFSIKAVSESCQTVGSLYPLDVFFLRKQSTILMHKSTAHTGS